MRTPPDDVRDKLPPCTACGAGLGEPCIALANYGTYAGIEKGRPIRAIHEARSRAWAAEIRGHPFPWLEPPASYAGVGSRKTPVPVQMHMALIAKGLHEKGWTLRSGAAGGADEAFWSGVRMQRETRAEIYLPWRGFNGFGEIYPGSGLTRPTEEAYAIAEQHHPAWRGLGPAAKSLLARNTHQVLGADCKTPAKFLVCWTRDGATVQTTRASGGTGQAIRVAVAHHIPVYNLELEAHERLWLRALGEMRLLEIFAKAKREGRIAW